MTRTSFEIPVTSQQWNFAAKFQQDRPSGLAGEVDIGDGLTDGQTVHDDDTLSGIPITDKLKTKTGSSLVSPLSVTGVLKLPFVSASSKMPCLGTTMYSHGLIKVYNQNLSSDLRIGEY